MTTDTDTTPTRTGHLYGYARVSTARQEEAMQIDALNAAGCERIFVDRYTGTSLKRPELDRLRELVLPGDVIVVYRHDRVSRSVIDMLTLVSELGAAGVGMRDLSRGVIDTTTANGRYLTTIFAATAELERNILAERTRDGVAAARARGRVGGRRSSVTPDKLASARTLIASGQSVTQAAATLGLSRSPLYRALRADNVGATT